VKSLSKLDYPTIFKQSTMSSWIGNSWGYHVWFGCKSPSQSF